MGGQGREDWIPSHKVTLSAFYMATTEVTFSHWKKVYQWAINHGYKIQNSGNNLRYAYGKNLFCPIDKVSWYDCVKWCNAASEMEGRTPCYTADGVPIRARDRIDVLCTWDANGYRLPSEAEWEYAAWGDETNTSYWEKIVSGDHEYCWYGANSGILMHPAGLKKANSWGLYDMSGNVNEWCWDLFMAYLKTSLTNPYGSTNGMYRIFRGGSFIHGGIYLSPIARQYTNPECDLDDVGFRVAVSAK